MNERLLKSIQNNPVKYAHLFGFDKLTDLHNEWIRTMIFEKDDYTLLGHRGSYKTTCLSVAFALIIILFPGTTILFLRKTDDDVTEIIRQVLKILKSDEMRYIVHELYGVDLILRTESAFKIDTNLNTSKKGQVQLQGMGLNASLTGKHADFVFTDDIVNVKDRVSKAEREQTKRQYTELQNVKNRTGRIFNTGTPWHGSDCISTKMPNIHKWTCYDTGLISDAELDQLRKDVEPSLFAANYELRIVAEQDVLIKTPPKFIDDISAIYDGMAHIDARYSGNDFTAYTILKKTGDGYIGYGKLYDAHVEDCIADIKKRHEKYRAGSVSCETNADKGYLAKSLRQNGFLVYEYSEKMNKHLKIATYLRQAWDSIKWIRETDKEYLEMITDYSEFAAHDDAPDSAASLIRKIKEQPTLNMDGVLIGGI